MHDRRIDGIPHTFGHEGVLYKRAMVWWDHETRSTWSQPTGTAISGPYRGVKLEAIPASVERWGTWKKRHPNTQVLAPQPGLHYGRGNPYKEANQFVIGLSIGSSKQAYQLDEAAKSIVINDLLDGEHLLIVVDPESNSIRVFKRPLIGTADLKFKWADGHLYDVKTQSRWDTLRGVATHGLLKGKHLERLPYVLGYTWAWYLHNPESATYRSTSD